MEMDISILLQGIPHYLPILSLYLRREASRDVSVYEAIVHYVKGTYSRLDIIEGERIFNHLSSISKKEISKWKYSTYEYVIFSFPNDLIAFLQRYSTSRIDYLFILKKDIRRSMYQYKDTVTISDRITFYLDDPLLNEQLRWIHN